MKPVLDFLSSVKLTLALLLGLSFVAIFGTIWPVQQDTIQRFELYYQSLWFRLLLGMLALNLAACTWRTFVRVLGEKSRLLALLANTEYSPQKTDCDLLNNSSDELSDRLRAQGYRVTTTEDGLLARRGLAGRWALPILHLSILAIMLGALAAQFGFVGTMNLYVTHQSDKFFNWDINAESPLGFTFRLDHFEPQYYPIELRFSTYDKQTKKELQAFTTREGETVILSPELSVQVLRFFPEEQHLVLGVIRDGALVGEYHTLSGKRDYPNSISLEVEIKPTAFRDPLLKQLHCEASILENGEVVRQGVIEVNHPLVHRGVAIYQTAYSRDESGFWTCGFQVSKDPGEPVVWAASIILVLALLMVFSLRFRAVGVVSTGDDCQLIPLAGFRGAAGKKDLDTLLKALNRTAESR